MIRSEREYNRALTRLEEEQNVITRQLTHFKDLGHNGEELNRLMQPLLSFHNQLKEEVEAYEGMKHD